MQIEPASQLSIEITDIAQDQLVKLRGAQANFLRVWVEQGGCSGMTYQAVIDDTPSPFDVTVFESDALRVVTDQNSRQFVEGMTIDYSDDLVEAGFRFINPHASKSCGCGQSFQQ
jgi:iron-sulfur cluster assembly protein